MSAFLDGILDKMQAKICSVILKAAHVSFDYRESKENLYKLCSLESLSYRRLYISVVALFKIIHKQPDNIATLNVTNHTVLDAPTRESLEAQGPTLCF